VRLAIFRNCRASDERRPAVTIGAGDWDMYFTVDVMGTMAALTISSGLWLVVAHLVVWTLDGTG
jgi:hypothetical protein